MLSTVPVDHPPDHIALPATAAFILIGVIPSRFVCLDLVIQVVEDNSLEDFESEGERKLKSGLLLCRLPHVWSLGCDVGMELLWRAACVCGPYDAGRTFPWRCEE